MGFIDSSSDGDGRPKAPSAAEVPQTATERENKGGDESETPSPRKRYCPRCTTRFAGDARFCPADGEVLRDEGRDHDWLVGSLVGDRYVVERKIGEGGMGVVYLAEHRRMHRKCALKVLRPEALAIPDAVSRFIREAENASRVSHPNIAAVYDCADAGDDLMYIAMEYIKGERLSDLLARERTLHPARVANILAQTASALRAAHELGIVHRDLKPDNIMLGTTHDGHDLVKVVDFGIARAMLRDSQRLTSTGMVLGTPAFMSPEQLTGQATDSRSDQYSLALVVYVMLTGALPYPGATAELGVRLLQPPKRLDEMQPSVEWPERLQDALTQALSVDAEARFETVHHFARIAIDTLAGWFPTEFSALGGRGTLEVEGVTGGPFSHTLAPTARIATPPTPIRTTTAVPRARRNSAALGGSVVLVAIAATTLVALQNRSPAAEPVVIVKAENDSAASLSDAALTQDSSPRQDAFGLKGAQKHSPAIPSAPSKASATATIPVIDERPSSSSDSVDKAPIAVVADSSVSQPVVTPETPPPPPPPPDHGFVRMGVVGDPASLYVNGSLRGSIARLQDIRVSTGQVTLRLRADGCQDWDTTVTVVPGDTLKVGRRRPKC